MEVNGNYEDGEDGFDDVESCSDDESGDEKKKDEKVDSSGLDKKLLAGSLDLETVIKLLDKGYYIE